MEENRSIWNAVTRDGTVLLGLSGLILMFCGAFALFLSFSGEFLPHDADAIGFTADGLWVLSPNLVDFMLHDRAAFGGVLLAIGALYVWLAAYPLANGQAWAWKTFCISGVLGFGSFLLYLGYGYLDIWHGIATLFLLIVFVSGLFLSRKVVRKSDSLRWFPTLAELKPNYRKGLSTLCFYFYAFGLISAGIVISIVGITTIFVPSDIEFIELCGADVAAISDSLLGVIAHDRAGFGGALLTIGVTVWLILSNAKFSKSLWQTLLVSGIMGFVPAIGIHFYIGYTDFLHVLPAFIGAFVFGGAIFLSRNSTPTSAPTG
ncbi:hypothetical protein [Puniceicoccus vermicola]|uniref:Uncharacterized protein n=1 Tax=Puniceicoccus vermicola TaxID=388746 RepID=A0A7X1B1W6_9BACT|nr:hypothetical protein [Puniceicoccus vermicola]MBC2603954.1 hypothetical protein [Puniceicoccus vermicola]